MRETKRVQPVEQEQIDAVKSFVSRQVWALIQLQLLNGARPENFYLCARSTWTCPKTSGSTRPRATKLHTTATAGESSSAHGLKTSCAPGLRIAQSIGSGPFHPMKLN